MVWSTTHNKQQEISNCIKQENHTGMVTTHNKQQEIRIKYENPTGMVTTHNKQQEIRIKQVQLNHNT